MLTIDRKNSVNYYDSELLFQYLNECNEKIKKKINKNDLVLVIGNTGAGKSTLVNYLIGHKMVLNEKHGDIFADIASEVRQANKEEYAQIGHQIDKSQTLFPEAYLDKRKNILYCDCPGFLDNREVEEKVAISISLELAIKNSNRVRGIIVAISYSELYAAKGQAFKELYNILDEMIKHIEDFSFSIVFVITRCKLGFRVENFLSYIKELTDSNQSLLKKTFDAFVSKMAFKVKDKKSEKIMKEKERVLKILNLIQNNSSNVVIADLTSETCWRTISSIFEANSNNFIPKESFNFSYDSNRMIFNDFVNDHVYEGLINLRRLVQIPLEIKEIDEKISDSNLKIVFFNSEIEKYNNLAAGKLVLNEQEKEESIKNKQNFLKTNQERLKSLTTNLSDLNSKREAILNEIKTLDSEVPCIIKKWDYTDKRSAMFGRFTRSKRVFTYSKPSTPILRVDKSLENGSFKDEKLNAQSGSYSVKYESEKGKDGKAKIEIYIMEKYKPDNIASISLRKFDLKNIDKKIQETTNSKTILEKDIQEIVKSIENLKNETTLKSKNQFESEKTSLKSDIEKHKETIVNLNKQRVKINNFLEHSVSYVNKNLRNIKLLEILVDSFKFKSNMARDFIYYLNEHQKFKETQLLSLNELNRKQSGNNLMSRLKVLCEEQQLDEIKTEQDYTNAVKSKETLLKKLDDLNRQKETITVQLRRIDRNIERWTINSQQSSNLYPDLSSLTATNKNLIEPSKTNHLENKTDSFKTSNFSQSNIESKPQLSALNDFPYPSAPLAPVSALKHSESPPPSYETIDKKRAYIADCSDHSDESSDESD